MSTWWSFLRQNGQLCRLRASGKLEWLHMAAGNTTARHRLPLFLSSFFIQSDVSKAPLSKVQAEGGADQPGPSCNPDVGWSRAVGQEGSQLPELGRCPQGTSPCGHHPPRGRVGTLVLGSLGKILVFRPGKTLSKRFNQLSFTPRNQSQNQLQGEHPVSESFKSIRHVNRCFLSSSNLLPHRSDNDIIKLTNLGWH